MKVLKSTFMKKQILNNKKQKIEKGVSPVIGVILLIVVVVILVAIVASLSLGFVGNIDESAQAGVSFTQNSINSSHSEVDVTLTSLDNADSIHIRTTNHTGSSIGVCGSVWESQGKVGSVVTIGDNSTPPSDNACDQDGFENNSIISIIGELEGQNTTITTYTVK